MCLIVFALGQAPELPLIIAANRDEFYQRPAAAAQFWDDQSDIFAGRDLEAGGTWLGVNRQGRFAALTNVREASSVSHRRTEALVSRGQLCVDYLTSSLRPKQPELAQYAGFNLLTGNCQQLYYHSNRFPSGTSLAAGVYALSNGKLNNDWPKVQGSRAALQQLISQNKINNKALLLMMQDPTMAAQSQLPDTGVGPAWERRLSSRFIQSAQYGTRCTTVVLFHRNGNIAINEQSYTTQGKLDRQRSQLIMPA